MDWETKTERDGHMILTRGQDRIQVNRDDDDLAGERWFFDFEPSNGDFISEQFRVRDGTDLRNKVKELVRRHTRNIK